MVAQNVVRVGFQMLFTEIKCIKVDLVILKWKTDAGNRPKNPCKDYNCEWLKDTRIPEWFKPSESGILLTGRKINKIDYLEITEAGSSLTIEMLNWLFQLHLKTGTNMYYEIKGGWNWMGTPEFCKEMQIKHAK